MDISESAAEPGRRPPVRDAWIVGLLGLAALVCLAWWVWSGSGPVTGGPKTLKSWSADPRLANYVGERACRECHPGETALQSRSGHAHTLRPAASIELAHWLAGRHVTDPEQPGTTWSYAELSGQLTVTRTEGGKSESFPIDFAFGSGHHATTLVTLTDANPAAPVLLEHRLTYFAAKRALGITPGQTSDAPEEGTTETGRVLPGRKALHCFECHTTATSAQGSGVLEIGTVIPNVTCERCHGPARQHVEAARRGETDLQMPMGLGQWTTDSQLLFCGQCHRHPRQAPPGRIRTDNPEIIRFQPVGLMQSPCFIKSGGRLHCLTCHDPHARASSDTAAYEAICRSCHQAPKHRTCPVSPRGGCLNCHMPRRDAGQGVLFTDHWIRVRRDEHGPERPRPER